MPRREKHLRPRTPHFTFKTRNVTQWLMGLRGPLLAVLLIVVCTGIAGALPKNSWSQFTSPTLGNPDSMGSYSAGCLAGAQTLPELGVGYQTMRPKRNRNFGHPDTVQFVQNLGKSLDELGFSVLIGDLSQPRGGPLPYGHTSHQTGLDVDVWFWSPSDSRTLTVDERNNLPFVSMLGRNRQVDPQKFTEEQISKLKISAEDPKVERIFVNPAIKTYLCSSLDQNDLHWVHKLRPWNGHDEHFHVRLHCPVGALNCKPQQAVEAGNGCEEAAHFPKTETDAEIDARATDGTNPLPSLPATCSQVLKFKNQAQDVH